MPGPSSYDHRQWPALHSSSAPRENEYSRNFNDVVLLEVVDVSIDIYWVRLLVGVNIIEFNDVVLSVVGDFKFCQTPI